jgi:hypothetical protein
MNYMSIPISKPVKYLLLEGDENPISTTFHLLSITNACLIYCGLLGMIDKNEF